MTSVSLSLPDGRVVHLGQTDALSVADRLWERAAEPGAIVCATAITQALRRPSLGRIELREREASMLATVLAEQ